MSTDQQKTKPVRFEPEVMQSLSKHRKGFETPNDCLKRLLNQRACTQVENRKKEEQKVKDDES